ncbi:MAG: hypothetical protein IT470_00285 [Pseudomonadales bacterium]|nr:hypothetical protein [Pseudomonadales bacterium]
MTANELRYLKVRFTNGEQRSFAFAPVEGAQPSTVYSRLEKLMQNRCLILQEKDSTIFLPFENIESIEVCPSPNVQIPTALQVTQEFS